MAKIIRVETPRDCVHRDFGCNHIKRPYVEADDGGLDAQDCSSDSFPPDCPLEDAPDHIADVSKMVCSVCHEPTPNYVFQSGMAFCPECYNNAMALRNMVADAMNAPLDVEEVFADLPKKQSEAIESNLKAIKRTNETHLLG